MGNKNNEDFKLSQKSIDEKEHVSEAELSYLNKILNFKLNVLNEGVVEVSKQQNDPASPLYSSETFESLRIKKPLLEALYIMGFHQPSKIQEAALPVLLCEPPQDIIAQSQSGTGKTATFLIALLNRIDPQKKFPQCICVAPTFELARQIHDVATKMSQFMEGVKIRLAVKGEQCDKNASFTEQIIIGTPGKMLEWLVTLKIIDAKKIIAFVLDEADVMICQEGYQVASIQIHNEIISSNHNCQCMLFSATYSDKVFQFAEKLIAEPVLITIRRQDQTLPYIRQYYICCKDREAKYKAILALYSSLTVASSIIFCYTKSSVIWLAKSLLAKDRQAGFLHGDMSAEERAKVVTNFRDGEFKVLITTNVAARGLDMPQVSLVVNYDPPMTYGENCEPDCDTYLHRIGRTGRFGKPGIAINLVDSEEALAAVKKFESYFGRSIKLLDSDDYEQLESIENSTQQSW